MLLCFPFFAPAVRAQAGPSAPVAVRVDVLDPPGFPCPAQAIDAMAAVVHWTIPVAVPPPVSPVPVELGVFLVSRLEPCASDPQQCDRSEKFQLDDPNTCDVTYGCADAVDRRPD